MLKVLLKNYKGKEIECSTNPSLAESSGASFLEFTDQKKPTRQVLTCVEEKNRLPLPLSQKRPQNSSLFEKISDFEEQSYQTDASNANFMAYLKSSIEKKSGNTFN